MSHHIRLQRRLDLAEGVIYLAKIYRKAVRNGEPRRALTGQDLDKAIERYHEIAAGK
jgi:hypothetical protein